MSALCFAHAEKVHVRGRVLGKVARNRGTCIEPGCEGMALYALLIEGPRPQPEPTPEITEEPPLPARAETSPTEIKRIEHHEQPRPIPCDRTRTCPHCILSRISPFSAFYMPAPSERSP